VISWVWEEAHIMDFNEYEVQVVTRLRLEELRATAARRALAAADPARAMGPGLRVRVGQSLIRLGALIEGRREARSGSLRPRVS